MTPKAFADKLALLTEHAPGLRRAGVRSLTVGDVTVTLAPPDVEPGPRGEAYVSTDPLSDPDTYGFSGRIPGFTREDLNGLE